MSFIRATLIEIDVQAFQKPGHGKYTWWGLTNPYWRGLISVTITWAPKQGKWDHSLQIRVNTFENVLEMHNLVYEKMADAGLARSISLEEQFWTNHFGDRLKTEEEASRSKDDAGTAHPELILFGDEIGTYINKTYDGQSAITNYCMGKGTKANIKSSTNGGRFTVIDLMLVFEIPP
jgi:hypothetical protein